MPQKAMILAAGLGQRMRPLSAHRPKPLITVAGKELISWSLDGLCAAGVRDVVINMHYLADQMMDFVDKYYDHRLTLTLSDERDQLLDSGGGVKNALKYLGDDPFFILNSDMIWQDGDQGRMLPKMQAFWQDEDMDILMLLVPRDKAFGYDAAGDYHRDIKGGLTARGQDLQADYVYGGIMIIKPECFKNSPDGPFSLRQQFDRAEKSGRLFGMIHDGPWYHVGTPGTRDDVEDIVIKCQDG
ncbi:MAG: mannose-1-phosphate guanylyltransferase [Alphaproteobacteria bacterium]|nr:MAG: mannose-1-phosphate guanylyltransferase [Alphaproteobacteria bacterium]